MMLDIDIPLFFGYSFVLISGYGCCCWVGISTLSYFIWGVSGSGLGGLVYFGDVFCGYWGVYSVGDGFDAGYYFVCVCSGGVPEFP